MLFKSKEELQNYFNSGKRVKYIFFWGHQKSDNHISKTCLSQWYHSPFFVNGKKFHTAEQYMMYEKAMLFGDHEIASKVLCSGNPGEAKKLGRMVKNFEESKWISYRFEIVVNANIQKFKEHPELREFLLSTKNRVIVEASPVDKIWGVGLSSDDPSIENPNFWKGLNLLGFALMSVRDKLNEI